MRLDRVRAHSVFRQFEKLGEEHDEHARPGVAVTFGLERDVVVQTIARQSRCGGSAQIDGGFVWCSLENSSL